MAARRKAAASAQPGRRVRGLAAAVLALALGGATPAVAGEPLHPTEGPIRGTGPIHGYTTDTAGHHSVNNYWLIGDDGVVAIDTHWRLSDAGRALAHPRQPTDKPIAANLLTHPHTDHVGGLPVFVEAAGEGVSVHGSEGTRRSIRFDEQGFIANRKDQFDADFPSAVPVPDRTLDDGPLRVAGLDLETLTLHGNEAIETTIFYLPAERALFTGDLVNGKTLPALYQGELDGWIAQLKTLRPRFPDAATIYPGHGAPGPAGRLLADQLAVLTTFRDLVAAELAQSGTLTAKGRERVAAAIEQRFRDWRTTAGIPTRRGVIERNIDWILQGWRVRGMSGPDPRAFREAEPAR